MNEIMIAVIVLGAIGLLSAVVLYVISHKFAVHRRSHGQAYGKPAHFGGSY